MPQLPSSGINSCMSLLVSVYIKKRFFLQKNLMPSFLNPMQKLVHKTASHLPAMMKATANNSRVSMVHTCPHSCPNAPISPVQVRLHKYIQRMTILILPQSPWQSFHILLVFWADMIHSGPSASPKVLGNLAVEKGASSTFARSSKSGFGNRILGDRAGQRFRATPSKIASPCIASSGDAHTFDELQNDYSLSISL